MNLLKARIVALASRPPARAWQVEQPAPRTLGQPEPRAPARRLILIADGLALDESGRLYHLVPRE